ncbi:hypothetical protein F7725_013703 [Dissostichus mawsoni]|uniref:Multiple inositol polyphosphate phosphatase 1 n=1 Tax=Dissostichus mawsoni TaxID=36200 RepID=A0A7J5YU53_DISMA|nr:hypothetical protein F7725_013703 [Dissostichus mawsoni]
MNCKPDDGPSDAPVRSGGTYLKSKTYHTWGVMIFILLDFSDLIVMVVFKGLVLRVRVRGVGVAVVIRLVVADVRRHRGRQLHLDVSADRKWLRELEQHELVFPPGVGGVGGVDLHLQLVHHELRICSTNTYILQNPLTKRSLLNTINNMSYLHPPPTPSNPSQTAGYFCLRLNDRDTGSQNRVKTGVNRTKTGFNQGQNLDQDGFNQGQNLDQDRVQPGPKPGPRRGSNRTRVNHVRMKHWGRSSQSKRIMNRIMNRINNMNRIINTGAPVLRRHVPLLSARSQSTPLGRVSAAAPPLPLPLLPEVPHIARFFGTKTRYEEVNRALLLDPLWVNRSVLRPPPGESCSPVHLTALIRHGSRFPTVKNIQRIRRLSEWWRPQGGSDRRRDRRGGRRGGSDPRNDRRGDRGLAAGDPELGELVHGGHGRFSLKTSSKHRCVSSMEAFREGLQARVQPEGSQSAARGQPEGSQSAARVQPECSQRAARGQPEGSQGSQRAARVQPECSQRAARGQPECSQRAARVQPEAARVQPEGSQRAARVQPEGSQSAARVQPECSQRAARGQPECSQSAAKGQPEGSQSAARGQPEGSQSAARVQPECSQSAAKGQPEGSQRAARGQPEGSQSAARVQPECSQRAQFSSPSLFPSSRAVISLRRRRAASVLRALPWLRGGCGEEPDGAGGGSSVQKGGRDGGGPGEGRYEVGAPPHLLTTDLVEAAFLLCSYELSIRSLNSPWCFLFTEEDARVLEYKSDLKQFWKRFHGHVISGVSSCPLFHHVFRTLDKAGRPRRATDAPPALTASVLLGHAETLLPLLSLLGLYRDPHPPTADNYQQQHGRTFRSGLIVPYAANLLFVLFDCQRGPRLQLLLNEKPVRFPGLPHDDAPLYRDVRAAYRPLLDGCDSARECEGRGGRAPNTEL